MTRTFSDGHPKVLPACSFLSQYYFYNIFLQKSCRFSLQTLTKFEAAKTGSAVGFLRLTAVWTSSNKSETAVHCCDPALSVLVMLVSRNVFHVVSALQSIVKKSARPEVAVFCADQKERGPRGRDCVAMSLYVIHQARAKLRSHTLPPLPLVGRKIKEKDPGCHWSPSNL